VIGNGWLVGLLILTPLAITRRRMSRRVAREINEARARMQTTLLCAAALFLAACWLFPGFPIWMRDKGRDEPGMWDHDTF
jgi:hypothetical protein